MDASLSLSSHSSLRKTFPFTTAPLPKEGDETWLKVAKIALTVFCACTIVIPLITLLADGIYYLYHNLSTPTVPAPLSEPEPDQKEAPLSAQPEAPPAVSAAPIPEVIHEPAPEMAPEFPPPPPAPVEPRSPISRIALAAAGAGLVGAAALAAYAYSGGVVIATDLVAADALAQGSSLLNAAAAAAPIIPAAVANLTGQAIASLHLGSLAQVPANVSTALHNLRDNVSSAVFDRSDRRPPQPADPVPVQPHPPAPPSPPQPETPRRNPFQSGLEQSQPPAKPANKPSDLGTCSPFDKPGTCPAYTNTTQPAADEGGFSGLPFLGFGLAAAAAAAAGIAARGPQQAPAADPDVLGDEINEEPVEANVGDGGDRTPRRVELGASSVDFDRKYPSSPGETTPRAFGLHIAEELGRRANGSSTPRRNPLGQRQFSLLNRGRISRRASDSSAPVDPQNPGPRRKSDPNPRLVLSLLEDDSKENSQRRRSVSSHSSTPDGIRSRRPSTDEYELVDGSFSFQSTQRRAPTTLENISSELASILFDPGNPEKGKKYHYALHAAQKSLNEHRDLNDVLEMLAEVAGAQNLDPIAHYRGAAKLTKPNFPIDAFCALSALTNFEGYPSIRAQYAHHLTHLRAALSNPDREQFPRAKKMLEDLCHTKYAGVYMYPHLESFVLKALRAPQGDSRYILPMLTLENLASEIDRGNKRLETVPAMYRKQGIALGYEKLKGTLGFDFDPTATANTPWVHSTISLARDNQERDITILRHGTPTSDPNFLSFLTREAANTVERIPGLNWAAGAIRNYSSHAAVIPEYRGFLDAAKGSVLYVNHQEHDEQDLEIRGEGDRSRAIQGLEQTHRNFHYLALPMDGHLWKTGYLESARPADFKQDVLSNLINETEGFAIPAALREHGNLAPLAEELWQKVQALYFNNQEPLSAAARRDFLMIFYSYLKTSLMIHLDVSYMNVSCKDDKDRGNASKLVDQMIRAVQTNTETDPDVLREIFFSALAPFIIKNEAILPNRLNLALGVLNRIAHLTPEQRDSIRNDLLLDGYRVVRQGIPKEEAKWGSVVKNPKDFLALVRQRQADEEEEIFEDSRFQTLIASTYRNHEMWNLERLRHQIRRDLGSTNTLLDGQRVETFDSLIESLGLKDLPFDKKEFDPTALSSNQTKSLRLLSMLHQGIVGPITERITLPFVGNPVGMLVRQMPPRADYYPTRIEANSQNRSILATQELELAFPDGESQPIPLEARVRVNKKGEASMMWRFLPSQQK